MLYRANALKVWQSHTGLAETWQTVAAVPALPAQGAQVWLCPLHEDLHLAQLLSDEEKARAANMEPEIKANEFALARGWLRVLLAAYVNAAEPLSIRLGIAENQKPFAIDYPMLHFNLSHSYDWLALAVSRHPVGIDIEKLRPVPDWRNLADGLFANLAVEEIAAQPETEQAAAFLRQFTAREAYLKATGTGLSETTIMLERDFHTIAMENQSYGPTVPLPEMSGYVGMLCVLNP
jgi:4'-phosphopantetheinyl transferase